MSFISNDYYLKCKKCGEPFFTLSDKEYYESNHWIFPQKCEKCKKNTKKKIFIHTQGNIDYKTVKLYDEIIENWSIEAKKEKISYFYNTREVDLILNGSKSFVIGRKGSGKTSIAQYLLQKEDWDVFCQKLSFKNFPFNILYALENQREYTEPNQYISIWKLLIYSYICRKMLCNYNIDADIRNKLGKLYGSSTIEKLNNLIGKWTSKEFGIEILGSGINYGREFKDKEISWIDSVDILERLILEYCDSSRYFIVFDELDEDYKDFNSKIESNRYKCMLTSLFKAIQDIRSIFDSADKKIYPVVFLRTDIYAQLTDSDKNKWRESVIDIEWDTAQIKNLLAHRVCVALNIPNESFEQVWYKVFSNENVRMGNKQGREMPIFDYIERSTEMRPRDFVYYIKECAAISKEAKENLISPETVKNADEKFSDYLKAETIDELFAVIPEINEILGLLSTIRKQSFNFSEFEHEYNILVKQKKVKKRDVKWVILKLFDAGVIGNIPRMKGKTIFRFSKNSPRFNFNEPMLIHRGLFKALQIF